MRAAFATSSSAFARLLFPESWFLSPAGRALARRNQNARFTRRTESGAKDRILLCRRTAPPESGAPRHEPRTAAVHAASAAPGHCLRQALPQKDHAARSGRRTGIAAAPDSPGTDAENPALQEIRNLGAPAG